MNKIHLERNLVLYPWYQAAASTMPWLPVFFLYFLELIPLDQIVRLGAIYYLAVVFSEVPSGYFSDRFGRRVTLLMSAVCLLLAYVLFIAAQGFYSLVVAEIFLAAGIAFQSGSDTSLLYDSLKRLGREDEYADRESKAKQYSMAASAVACLVGGLTGVYSLTIPYVISAFAAVATIVLCYRLTEPEVDGGRKVDGFFRQIKNCVIYLAKPLMLWVLCFYVAGYSLQHVLYEFYQPYIKLLDIDFNSLLPDLQRDSAPAISGVVFGLSMLVGVAGARFGMLFFRTVGLSRLLLSALVFQSLVVGLMGYLLHPLILLLVISRNFSMAMVHGPMLGAIGPLIDSHRRATYLSMQSFAARLGFSLLLFLLSLLLDADGSLDWPALSALLQVSAIAGMASLVLLGLTARLVRNAQSD